MMKIWLMGLLVLLCHQTNAECRDKYGYCRNIKYMCDNQYVQEICRETCGLCADCQDEYWYCKSLKDMCADKDFVRDSCPHTCESCAVKKTMADN